MQELAAQFGDPKPVRLTDIANKHGISSPRFLVQILIQLNKAGLVTSTRGAAGGYHIARSPATITLADLVAAVEAASRPGRVPRPASRRPRSPRRSTTCVGPRPRRARRVLAEAGHYPEGHNSRAARRFGEPLQYVI